MIAIAALIGLLAPATPQVLAHLAVAQPQEVAAAVVACARSVSMAPVNEAKLVADGWTSRPMAGGKGRYFTRQDNASTLLTLDAPLNGTCFVRARVAGATAAEQAGEAIDRALGDVGQRRDNDPSKIMWRTGDRLIALEPFDEGPGGQPHLLQIVVVGLPKEYR